MILGHFSARVESDITDRDRITDQHGTCMLTDNESRLCDVRGDNDLVIGGILFHHKIIHKLSLTSTEMVTQIYTVHLYHIRIIGDPYKMIKQEDMLMLPLRR